MVVGFLKYIRIYVAIHIWYLDTSKNKGSINIMKDLQVLNLNMMAVTCLALRSAFPKWNMLLRSVFPNGIYSDNCLYCQDTWAYCQSHRYIEKKQACNTIFSMINEISEKNYLYCFLKILLIKRFISRNIRMLIIQ